MIKEKLADSELDIMRVLWKEDRAMKASEIVKALAQKRKWTKQTVHVLLSRLETKGFVKADRSGYYHYFSAAIAENEYLCNESSRIVEKVGASMHSMLASLIEADELSDEDIIAISDMLNEKRREIGK
ncbi:MAG: BlaI/MecI/CopY family transcriptional regulator [Clostridia bacterium]|nr:BlaI/MecI/CopY family transcriptional regulator [Clostridia bacterium]